MTRRRIVTLYLALVALLLVATFVVLRETGVSHTFVENVVARFLDRDRFRISDSDVDLSDGTVTLRDVRLSTGDVGADETPIVSVDRVEVDVNTNPLGDVGEVQQVRLQRGSLRLDLSSGEPPDLSAILARSADDLGAATDDGDLVVPPIVLEEWTVALRTAADGAWIEFRDVSLSLLPEEAGSSAMVLSGSMVSPNGFVATVHGNGDVRTQAFRAAVQLTSIPLSPEVARPYAPGVVDYLHTAGVRGTAQRLTIWFESDEPGKTAPGEDPFRAGVQIELDDIAFKAPELPWPLVGATLKASAETRDGGSARFRVDSSSVDGNVTIEGQLSGLLEDEPPDYSIKMTGRDVLVGPVVREALLSQQITARVWNAFRPVEGRVDVTAVVRPDPDSPIPDVDLDLQLHGTGLAFHGFPRASGPPIRFPYRVRNANGLIQIRKNTIHIQDVAAQVGPGTLRLSGTVDLTPRGQRDVVSLDLVGEDLEFSEEIRTALAELSAEAAEVWTDYGPVGRTDLGVQVRSRPPSDPRPVSVWVQLRPRGCQCTYADFPVPVDNVRGIVEIAPTEVLVDLQGSRRGTAVAVQGRFYTGDSVPIESERRTPLRSELRVTTRDLELDAQIGNALAALGPQLAEVWTGIRPSGRAHSDLSMWRPWEPSTPDQDDDAFSYDIRVDLDGASVVVTDLELPIEQLRGPLFVHGDGATSRADLSAIRGTLVRESDPAEVLVQGSVVAEENGRALDIVAVCRGLPLDDELADELDSAGVFRRTTWDVLDPSGNVDVTLRLRRAADEEDMNPELRLLLRDVRADADVLPYPAEQLYGEVVVAGNTARLERATGRMGTADIVVTDALATWAQGMSTVSLSLRSPSFPIDDSLANLLTGPLRKTFLDREIRGDLALRDLDLELRFPDTSDEFETRASGEFHLNRLRMKLGAELRNVSGRCVIEEARVAPTGGTVRGRVDGFGFSLLGHRAESITSTFRADSSEVVFDDVAGRMHNGRITGLADDGRDIVYGFGDVGALTLGIGWENLSLRRLLAASGIGEDRFWGNLSGELYLDRLAGGDLVEATGRGRLSINEGNLGEVPLFTAIYSYLSPRRRPRFEKARFDYSIGDRRLAIRNLELESSLLSATGEGEIGMDGYLDMRLDFPDLFGTAADWLVLPQILRVAVNQVVGFQIYGYYNEPVAKPRWLWQGEPDRVPIGPVPSRRRK